VRLKSKRSRDDETVESGIRYEQQEAQEGKVEVEDGDVDMKRKYGGQVG